MTQLVKRHSALLAPQMDFILLDASISMSDKWYPLMAAVDLFVDTLKASNMHSHGIVSTFAESDTVGTVVLDSPIADWPLLGQHVKFLCGGATALYDGINFMGREMAHYQPERASIVIMTDGGETGSQHTDVHQARAILDWCRAQGWQVTFFGCDFDNAAQAQALGADARQFIGVDKQHLKEAAKSLGDKRVRYGHGADDIGFDDDEKSKFGGYLGHG